MEVKPKVIDTWEAYWELDEEGDLYKNGILYLQCINDIRLCGLGLVVTRDPPTIPYRHWRIAHLMTNQSMDKELWRVRTANPNPDGWIEKLFRNQVDMVARDFLNHWTSGNTKPIMVGDIQVGTAYFDEADGEDYTATITDPRFLSSVKVVHDADGRVRSWGSEGVHMQQGHRFTQQFIGRQSGLRAHQEFRKKMYENRFRALGIDPADPESVKSFIEDKVLRMDDLPDYCSGIATTVAEAMSSKSLPLTFPSKEEADQYMVDFHITLKEDK